MTIRSPLEPPLVFEAKEKTTGHYTGVLTDDDATVLPAASLVTLTLSLYAILTDGSLSYIRNAQNVLNANNVTVDSNGNINWHWQVADTTLIEDLPFERHIALFTWTTSGSTGRHEFVLNVQNLVAVS